MPLLGAEDGAARVDPLGTDDALAATDAVGVARLVVAVLAGVEQVDLDQVAEAEPAVQRHGRPARRAAQRQVLPVGPVGGRAAPQEHVGVAAIDRMAAGVVVLDLVVVPGGGERVAGVGRSGPPANTRRTNSTRWPSGGRRGTTRGTSRDRRLRAGSGLAGAGHLPLGVALGHRLALVEGALAARQAEVDLDEVPLEVQPQRHQGEAALGDLAGELVDLPAVQQQLPRAGRLVALVAGAGVGGDPHVEDHVAAFDDGVGVLQRRLALPQGLHLAAAQHDAGLDGLDDLVVVAGTAVGRDRARGLTPGHRYRPGQIRTYLRSASRLATAEASTPRASSMMQEE